MNKSDGDYSCNNKNVIDLDDDTCNEYEEDLSLYKTATYKKETPKDALIKTTLNLNQTINNDSLFLPPQSNNNSNNSINSSKFNSSNNSIQSTSSSSALVTTPSPSTDTSSSAAIITIPTVTITIDDEPIDIHNINDINIRKKTDNLNPKKNITCK